MSSTNIDDYIKNATETLARVKAGDVKGLGGVCNDKDEFIGFCLVTMHRHTGSGPNWGQYIHIGFAEETQNLCIVAREFEPWGTDVGNSHVVASDIPESDIAEAVRRGYVALFEEGFSLDGLIENEETGCYERDISMPM